MTKFTASYNGKIIGTRKSPRPYKFAIIVQSIEDAARKRAYEYVATETDRSNFDYACEIAGAFPEVICQHSGGLSGRPWSTKHTADQIEKAKQEIDGGFDAYVARLREQAIKRFEDWKARGGYEPKVHGWSMSQHNAQKMAAQAACPGRVVLGIVPAVAS